MSNNLEMKRNSVKIVLGGKTKPSVGIIMQNANDLDATDKNAFDVIRSIRQVLQKPDVSHIQLLAWLRKKRKNQIHKQSNKAANGHVSWRDICTATQTPMLRKFKHET